MGCQETAAVLPEDVAHPKESLSIPLEAGDGPQQRGLTAPRGTEHSGDPTGGEGHIYVQDEITSRDAETGLDGHVAFPRTLASKATLGPANRLS